MTAIFVCFGPETECPTCGGYTKATPPEGELNNVVGIFGLRFCTKDCADEYEAYDRRWKRVNTCTACGSEWMFRDDAGYCCTYLPGGPKTVPDRAIAYLEEQLTALEEQLDIAKSAGVNLADEVALFLHLITQPGEMALNLNRLQEALNTFSAWRAADFMPDDHE